MSVKYRTAVNSIIRSSVVLSEFVSVFSVAVWTLNECEEVTT